MNVLFLSEQYFIGKVSDNTNMRTEYGWMKMLDAFHLPYTEIKSDSQYMSVLDTADFVIVIPSKKNPQFLAIGHVLKKMDKKFGIMQEGPNYLWQDWPVEFQIMYLGIIKELADIVFVHNEHDAMYFSGITNKPIVSLKTVFDDTIEYDFSSEKTNSVIIGGNMVSWYGGMNSYLSIRNLKVDSIVLPSMGRKQEKEEELLKQLDERIQYLPYMPVKSFIEEIAKHKLAIHLMPTAAAGSFSLNCALARTPCIGNIDDDTQRILFPDLAINVTDINKAKFLAKKLLEDQVFYDEVTTKALNNLNYFNLNKNRDAYVRVIQELSNAK